MEHEHEHRASGEKQYTLANACRTEAMYMWGHYYEHIMKPNPASCIRKAKLVYVMHGSCPLACPLVLQGLGHTATSSKGCPHICPASHALRIIELSTSCRPYLRDVVFTTAKDCKACTSGNTRLSTNKPIDGALFSATHEPTCACTVTSAPFDVTAAP